ncbi:MAG: hypothetical protein AAGF06_02565 [Pseudomonadota bacterium]
MSQPITQRKVFYLAGFDPRPSQFYYDLFVREFTQWSTTNDKKTALSDLNTDDADEHTFRVNNATDKVDTEFSFLNWNHVVSPYWNIATLSLVYYFLRYYLSTLKHSNWSHISSLGKNSIQAYILPLIFIVAGTLGSCLLLNILFDFLLGDHNYLLLKIACSIGVLGLVTYVLMKKIKPLWILRAMAFNYRVFPDEDGPLMQHLDTLAQKVYLELTNHAEQYDEVLLMSHSFGTILAPIIMNKVNALNNYNPLPTNFTLVTLAQQSPNITCYNKAIPFQRHYQELSAKSPAFDWLDISSPADGICFYACNPFAPICDEGRIALHYKSPRFHAMYSKESYAHIKKNRFLLHFKYLYAHEMNSPTNYFQLVTGNQSIKRLCND